jgi:DNA-directed RNA polymerase II subunit RPB1
MHFPRSILARAEVQQLMMVPRMLLGDGRIPLQVAREPFGSYTPLWTGKQVFSLMCDDVKVSMSLLTQRNVFIGRELMMDLVMAMDYCGGSSNSSRRSSSRSFLPIPSILLPTRTGARSDVGSYTPLWTGKQVFSLLCPPVTPMTMTNKTTRSPRSDLMHRCAPSDEIVIVEEGGELLCGRICGANLGLSEGLLHRCVLECGFNDARIFVERMQAVGNCWLGGHHSFSFGVRDMAIPVAESRMRVQQQLSNSLDEVRLLIKKGRRGELTNIRGKTVSQSCEAIIMSILDLYTRDRCRAFVCCALPEWSSLRVMMDASSGRVSPSTVCKLLATVGQAHIQESRIPTACCTRNSPNGRALPHFTRDDDGPAARGFIRSSFFDGLDPKEFFFHAMASRETMQLKARSARTAGVLQKRLVATMGRLCVCHDGSVRSGRGGQIVQFVCGEDGLDSERCERQTFDHLSLIRTKFESSFKWEDECPAVKSGSTSGKYELERELRQLQLDRAMLRQRLLAPVGWQYVDWSGEAELPVHVKRLVGHVQQASTFPTPLQVNRMLALAMASHRRLGRRSHAHRLPKRIVRHIFSFLFARPLTPASSPLDPVRVAADVRALTERLMRLGQNSMQQQRAQLFCAMVRCHLASKRVVLAYQLDEHALEWLLWQIETKYSASLLQAGEPIGMLAALSIVEPAIMTVDFGERMAIRPGCSTIPNSDPGVVGHLLGSTSRQMPNLTIYLEPSMRYDSERAKSMLLALQVVGMRAVISRTQIIYDPDPVSTVVEEDKEFVEIYYEMPEDEIDTSKLSPWLLRIELNREMMADKELTMKQVADCIGEEYGSDLNVIYNDDYADKLVLRIRIMNEGTLLLRTEYFGNAEEDIAPLKRVQASIHHMKLRGVTGLTRVCMNDVQENEWDEDDGVVRNIEKQEWIIFAEGTNLGAVLSTPGVDATRTISNCPVEVSQV